MHQNKKQTISFSILLIGCIITLGCANPFGKGTWRPLPFKKWQEVDSTNISSKDTTGTKN